jgi:hypothetical protein
MAGESQKLRQQSIPTKSILEKGIAAIDAWITSFENYDSERATAWKPFTQNGQKSVVVLKNFPLHGNIYSVFWL